MCMCMCVCRRVGKEKEENNWTLTQELDSTMRIQLRLTPIKVRKPTWYVFYRFCMNVNYVKD